MTTPLPDGDAAEQAQTATGLDDPGQPTSLPAEATEADAVEQAVPAAPGPVRAGGDLPLEADEADVAEQDVVVPLDEDEGRA